MLTTQETEIAAARSLLSHRKMQRVSRWQISLDQRELLKQSFLLTTKPILSVVNIGEDQLDDVAKLA